MLLTLLKTVNTIVYAPSLLFPLFSRGHHKVEEACEMYCRAANMFKMAKNWSGAISSLLKID